MPSLLWDLGRSAFVALAEALLQGFVRTLQSPWSRQGVSDRAPGWGICASVRSAILLDDRAAFGSHSRPPPTAHRPPPTGLRCYGRQPLRGITS